MTRMLCVDDEKYILDSLTLFLDHLGVQARCVLNGRECIREFEASRLAYDLVMVNFDLPGMTGPEVVEKLRAIDGRQMIALTSGYPEEEVFRFLNRSEVVEFLPKPYTMGQLRSVLRRILPGVAPQAVAMVGAGHADRPWLRSLTRAASPSGSGGGRRSRRRVGMAEVYTEPNDALNAAMKGLAKVLLWEVDAGLPQLPLLETLRREAIPILFVGSAPGSAGLEALGPLLSADVQAARLIEAVHEAIRSAPPPQRDPQR